MKQEVEDIGSTAVRDRRKPATGMSEAEQKEMQKKVEAAATPGPAHKALDEFVGDWNAEVSCWMEPGAPAHMSRGTAKAKWTLDGHFLEEEFQGEMMGKAFTGRTLIGYDNVKKTYKTVWISDMQTSIFTSEGRGDSTNKVITLEGKSSCAATGRTDVPIRTVYRTISPDKHVFEMYDGSKGDNVKTMEIIYTRK